MKIRYVLIAAVFIWFGYSNFAGAGPAKYTIVSQTSSSSFREFAIGYSPPDSSSTKIHSYSEILNELNNLASVHDHLKIIPIPNATTKGKTIHLIKISDPDTVRDDGTPEPKVFYIAGIHAREWASVETVLKIIGDFANNFSPNGSDELSFLIRNSEIYFLPVLNRDAFEYTHAFPNSVFFYENFRKDDSSPYHKIPLLQRFPRKEQIISLMVRDGRLQRKNLNGKVGEMDPAEALNGVDLNRNYSEGFSLTGSRASLVTETLLADQESEIYQGTSPESEQESKTIFSMATLANGVLKDRLRFVIDYHAAARSVILVSHSDLDFQNQLKDIAKRLVKELNSLNTTRSPKYSYILHKLNKDPSANYGRVGALINFFNSTLNIPAVSIELPPNDAEVKEKLNSIILFSSPKSHQNINKKLLTFLPDINDLNAMFIENKKGNLLATRWAAQDPYVKKIEVEQDLDNDGVYEKKIYDAEWEPDPTDPDKKRRLCIKIAELINKGNARITVFFSEPMADQKIAKGDPKVTLGINDPFSTVTFKKTPTFGGWGTTSYDSDTWKGEASIPTNLDKETVTILVDAVNRIDNKLDAYPATVRDFSGGRWVHYQNRAKTDSSAGGEDTTHTVGFFPPCTPKIIDIRGTWKITSEPKKPGDDPVFRISDLRLIDRAGMVIPFSTDSEPANASLILKLKNRSDTFRYAFVVKDGRAKGNIVSSRSPQMKLLGNNTPDTLTRGFEIDTATLVFTINGQTFSQPIQPMLPKTRDSVSVSFHVTLNPPKPVPPGSRYYSTHPDTNGNELFVYEVTKFTAGDLIAPVPIAKPQITLHTEKFTDITEHIIHTIDPSGQDTVLHRLTITETKESQKKDVFFGRFDQEPQDPESVQFFRGDCFQRFRKRKHFLKVEGTGFPNNPDAFEGEPYLKADTIGRWLYVIKTSEPVVVNMNVPEFYEDGVVQHITDSSPKLDEFSTELGCAILHAPPQEDRIVDVTRTTRFKRIFINIDDSTETELVGERNLSHIYKVSSNLADTRGPDFDDFHEFIVNDVQLDGVGTFDPKLPQTDLFGNVFFSVKLDPSSGNLLVGKKAGAPE